MKKAKRKAVSRRPRSKRPAPAPETTSERELLDFLTKAISRQFGAMAERLDKTNRRLEELFARVEGKRGRRLPSLRRFRIGIKRKRAGMPSVTLLRRERDAR